MWRLSLVRVVLFLLCAEYSSNVRGLEGNLSDLTTALSQYGILLCSVTLFSDMRHVSEFLVPEFGRPSCCAGARCLGPEGWLHTYEIVTEHFANPNFSMVLVKCYFSGFVV